MRPAESAPRELPPKARTFGVVIWCSFLAASAATLICFAILDPLDISRGWVPAWWTTRYAVYAVGFFFFWAVGIAAAVLTIYMAHTEHTTADVRK